MVVTKMVVTKNWLTTEEYIVQTHEDWPPEQRPMK